MVGNAERRREKRRETMAYAPPGALPLELADAYVSVEVFAEHLAPESAYTNTRCESPMTLGQELESFVQYVK